jgi:ABC-type transport system involved in multi-copper enzyme maturation permease subunit
MTAGTNMLGPIFDRELTTLPRKGKHYVGRVVFCLAMFVLMWTVWLLMAGIQPIRELGDFARFGSLVFQIIAPLQLVVLACLAAISGAISVSHEKDRKTLILLLMTSLKNRELVLGKAGGGFLIALNLFLAGLPVLALLTLLGGVSTWQVLLVAWVTLTTILAATALGSTVAFWREKTFQAIAITILAIVLWMTFCEAIAAGAIAFLPTDVASILNPLRAIMRISQPLTIDTSYQAFGGVELLSGLWMLIVTIGLLSLSIVMLRVWNPSREARPKVDDDSEAVRAAAASVDSTDPSYRNVKAWKSRDARRVWNNPVLWREMRTWAYGRKVLIVRFAYLLLTAIVAYGLYRLSQAGTLTTSQSLNEELIPAAAKLFAPFAVISLVIINALAVNSISNERDSQALDLLLVTEITPPSFLFGKLVGVLYVCKEMVLAPIALGVYLWTLQGITTENLIFTIVSMLVLDLFVAMLGIHCGIIYYRSRTAIATSLGTVFFLFLGVTTCMLIMISFQGSFGRQLGPFFVIIVGGFTALYYALGSRNPSTAITFSALLLPFLTFFSITSFILRNQELTVTSVIVGMYGFATLSMIIPAISEFDFALGRTPTADDAEG